MPTKPTTTQTEDDALFREFEHTGDIGIELTAPTRAELFRRAAIALAALLVERASVAEIEQREIAVEADADLDLMHDLLGELLALFTVEGFIWRDASVEEADRSLRVTVRGEPFDPGRHEFRGEIKAVTYHQLMVENSLDGWRSRIIFDV
ncbi:MAG: archease [Candidatus Binatus sp.]|uniref:archease n=1 Tax=Candidatus Binatus sp. TaxID=2811406 RepID=UPI00271D0089|nr:archease [Candidatus Binatus sp.]MDO8431022.1 archease [Candidatus Binatus sp.]